jgi:putative ABC transport system ATP-binding protein
LSPIVEGRAIEKSFGSTLALRGVDCAVEAGEVVAIMGPSGSGKSTLLHCLAGILRPDAGQVYFDGKRIDQQSERQRSELRRRRFGFVFQFGQLVPELPALENVALPLLLDRRRRHAALAAAAEWFERLDPARPRTTPARGAVGRRGPAGGPGPGHGRPPGGGLRR